MKPSDIYFIEDDVTAWCFNRAVMMFGLKVENDMSKARSEAVKQKRDEDAAAQYVLNSYLGTGSAAKFRDPAKHVSF